MRRSKFDTCELVARNDYIDCLEKNVIELANPLKLSNTEVDNINKQFFEIRLEINTTIKNLATLTIYNY